MTKKFKRFVRRSQPLKRCFRELRLLTRNSHLKVLFPLSFLILAFCQTKPIRYDQVQEGQWSAKVLIKDKKTNKSYVVRMDVNAQRNERIRLDITHIFKGHLASLVLNGKKVEYLLIPERKFYSGTASSRSLKPLFPVPIHPKFFYNLFFDRPILQKNWTCLKGKKGHLSECRNLQTKLKIRWTHRKGVKKSIFVDHKLGRLQVNISSFTPKVSSMKNLFILKKPKSFRLHEI